MHLHNSFSVLKHCCTPADLRRIKSERNLFFCCHHLNNYHFLSPVKTEIINITQHINMFEITLRKPGKCNTKPEKKTKQNYNYLLYFIIHLGVSFNIHNMNIIFVMTNVLMFLPCLP